MDRLTIGKAAEQGGVNLQTIRYYEREGLIPKPPRTDSGYRMFSADTVQRLRFIKRAQKVGFSLAEIRELLQLQGGNIDSCPRVNELVRRKLIAVRSHIRELQTMESYLKSALRSCNRVLKIHGGACPVLKGIENPKRESGHGY